MTKLFKGTKMIRANFNKDNDPKHYAFWKKLVDKNKNDAKIKELIDSEAESRAVKKNVLKSIEGHDIPEIYEICTAKELQTLLQFKTGGTNDLACAMFFFGSLKEAKRKISILLLGEQVKQFYSFI